MRGKNSGLGSTILTVVIACAYLLLCLVFGGASRENENWNAIVQIAGLLALAFLVGANKRDILPSNAWPLAVVLAAIVCVGGVSLIPIPPELWTRAPGRENVAAAFGAIGAVPPWLPLSLAPVATFSALLNLIPPLAVFLLACRLNQSGGIEPLVWIIPAVALASLGLGLAQVYGGEARDLYFYRVSNRGLPAGLFANVNHQATLLLVAIPFAAALFQQLRARAQHGAFGWEKAVLALVALLVLSVGVLVTGSIAGYVLLLPVLFSSVAILTTAGALRTGRSLAAFVGAFILVAGIMAGSPFVLASNTSLDSGPLSRVTIYQNTWRAIQDFMPAGTGLGSFDSIYPLYEDPRTPALQFVNHAHSDALEILLELGAPGAVLILIFLAWYLQRSGKIWAQERARDVVMAKAATIAVAVILLHSLIDYPSRTVAISCLGAVSLAIMVGNRRDQGAVKLKGEDGPLRGLVL